jgi:hypothetical protein
MSFSSQSFSPLSFSPQSFRFFGLQGSTPSLADSGSVSASSETLALQLGRAFADMGTVSGQESFDARSSRVLSDSGTLSAVETLSFVADLQLTDSGELSVVEELVLLAHGGFNLTDEGSVGAVERLTLLIVVDESVRVISLSDEGVIFATTAIPGWIPEPPEGSIWQIAPAGAGGWESGTGQGEGGWTR